MAAVGAERVSAVVGYQLSKANTALVTGNLPQRIAILGEANTTNQSGLDTSPTEVTNATQAGQLYGFGSPIYQIMRILKPVGGDGVGGIPIVVYPQVAAEGAAAKVMTITVTGTATASVTHNLVIAGRRSIDGNIYGANIAAGDTPTAIATKIKDAINNVLGAPCTATSALGVVTVTSKWAGLTSQELDISIETGVITSGVTYAIAQTTAGAGTPNVGAALQSFGAAWNTLVINGYGLQTDVLTALEAFNGRPDTVTPTGRYSGIIFKPFIAVCGSVAEDSSSVTDSKRNNVTIAVAPAPLSKGFSFEAAANMVAVYAPIAQNTPHLDALYMYYPDMPTPANIGLMASYDERDRIVKKGHSTVDLVAGAYQVIDFVTTYRPLGEEPPQFRYVRNLTLDFNIRYGYWLLEQTYVVAHTICADNDTVNAVKTIKPKQWKGLLIQYAEGLGTRALIADVPYMQDSIHVNISNTNPDRFETQFNYKRTGTVRISATVASATFNFGTN